MLLRMKDATLAQHAGNIAVHLRQHGFSSVPAGQRQVLVLAEEVGEFVGAYRRWSGQARRAYASEMQAELADVVITAYVTAHELTFDLDAAIAHKLEIIYSRGWREEHPPDLQRRVPRIGDLVKFRTGSRLWRITHLVPGDRCRISPVLHANDRVYPRIAPLNRLIATEEYNGDLS